MNAPELHPGEVHVWTLPLDPARPPIPAEAALLSEEERRRASKFVFERDLRLFVARRAALRRILAAYLKTSPASLRLRAGRFGKPELAPPSNGGGLGFNASHSSSLGLVAVARGTVGIDVEQERITPDLAGVAELVLSPRELEAFHAMAGAGKLPFFYAAWTRKEAYLKALGDGLMRSPAAIECGSLLGEPGDPIRDLEDPAAGERWRVAAWKPAPGYHAAVAAPPPLNHIEWLHFSS